MQGLYHPVPLLTGAVSRSDYSATMHDGLNLWPWNVMDKELRQLPDSSRVYILGNEQVFGFPKRFWYSSVHDDTPLVLWANESANESELLDKLKKEKFTHLLLNAPEAIRLRSYHLFDWTESGKKVFVDFSNKHLQLVDVKPIANYPNSLFLFEIKDAVDRPSPLGDFGAYFANVLNFKSS